jgi:hypothetical protein
MNPRKLGKVDNHGHAWENMIFCAAADTSVRSKMHDVGAIGYPHWVGAMLW